MLARLAGQLVSTLIPDNPPWGPWFSLYPPWGTLVLSVPTLENTGLDQQKTGEGGGSHDKGSLGHHTQDPHGKRTELTPTSCPLTSTRAHVHTRTHVRSHTQTHILHTHTHHKHMQHTHTYILHTITNTCSHITPQTQSTDI